MRGGQPPAARPSEDYVRLLKSSIFHSPFS
jgi:hypothetical protein